MKSKKAAMEMSVGTIVTIVLLMSVLILGLVMIKNIFGSAKGAVDLTDQELQNQISQAFGNENAKLAVYPASKYVEVKAGESDAIGIGVKNVASTLSEGTSFTYQITQRGNSCSLTEDQSLAILQYGPQGSLTVPAGTIKSDKIRFSIPENYPNCVIKLGVEVYRGTTSYDSEFFEVEIKA